MTKAQQVAAVLLRPELSRDPAYSEFKKLVAELVSKPVSQINTDMIERMHAAIPQQ